MVATFHGVDLAPAFAARPRADFAGLGRRVAAWVIDAAIETAGLYPLSFAVAYLLADLGPERVQQSVLALILVFDWLYFALFESSRWRATPGKRLLQIVVVDLDGQRLRFNRATWRYAAKSVAATLLFVGILMIAWTPRHQGMHDRLVRTLVPRARVALPGSA